MKKYAILKGKKKMSPFGSLFSHILGSKLLIWKILLEKNDNLYTKKTSYN